MTKLRALIGSGDRVMMFTLPFAAVGIALNVAFPSAFEVGGPSDVLRLASIVVLAVGVVLWLWSVVLILTKAAKGELITTGPFRLVKHPLYTAVSLLVIPWLGFLLDTWVGVVIGMAMYVGARLYAPREEDVLAETFGPAWAEYAGSVKLPWL